MNILDLLQVLNHVLIEVHHNVQREVHIRDLLQVREAHIEHRQLLRQEVILLRQLLRQEVIQHQVEVLVHQEVLQVEVGEEDNYSPCTLRYVLNNDSIFFAPTVFIE